MKTKHSKKKNFFTKKNILLIVVGLTLLLWVGFLFKFDDNMSASVLNLSQIARNRKASFSVKPKEILPTICIDSDGGIDYTTKWTIFLSWGVNRMEEDSCNTNGTLRERFCGQPWDVAGLLRSENYVTCPNWCNNWACLPTTGNIIRDISIENGYFIASDNQHANMQITIKNIGNIAMSTDGIWHGLSLDGNTYVDYWVAYDLQLTNNSNTILQPNETYTIFANVTLMGNNYFSNNSYININVSTYPDTDDIPSNNSYNLYLTGNFSSSTGQIVDCSTPENILNCNLWLPSCPPECTGQIFTGWIGDIIIENMFITPNAIALREPTNTINKVNLTVKNIGQWNIVIPIANWAYRLSLWCNDDDNRWWWSLTTPIWQWILLPWQSITTQLYGGSDHWFNDLWLKSITCIIDSQQQWQWSTPDPYNTGTIYESNGQNNSFTLNYTVTWAWPEAWDLIIEDMFMTPNNTPLVGTDNSINKINLVVKNIGQTWVILPANLYSKLSLICYYEQWHWGFHTKATNTNIIQANQSITTQIEIINPIDDIGWFSTIWPKQLQCILVSQQQQNRDPPNPNNQYSIYESDWTNNSFTLDYEVVPSKTTQTLRDKLRK